MSNKKANNTLETWGNEATMNLNAIIYQNILSSPYFRSLYGKKTFHEIVDEIYNEVYVLSPFVKGTQPSTAYCCLFKMWTLRLTVKQLENMIDHVDSPYIRAIGFLYLRYVCSPAQLWDWFQYYLEDEEEVAISSGVKPKKITIGKLCRMLITEPKFESTMLPRIPVLITRDLEKKLHDYDREARKGPNAKYDDEKDDKYHSRSYRNDSRARDASRSPSRDSSRKRGRRDSVDDLDDYERRSRHRDTGKSRDRHRSHSRDRYRTSDRRDRRRSVSPSYRGSRHHSRSRSIDNRPSEPRSYSRDDRRHAD